MTPLPCGVEPARLASLNFETQHMSAKRAALVTALRTERLEYEDLGILTSRGQVFDVGVLAEEDAVRAFSILKATNLPGYLRLCQAGQLRLFGDGACRHQILNRANWPYTSPPCV